MRFDELVWIACCLLIASICPVLQRWPSCPQKCYDLGVMLVWILCYLVYWFREQLVEFLSRLVALEGKEAEWQHSLLN